MDALVGIQRGRNLDLLLVVLGLGNDTGVAGIAEERSQQVGIARLYTKQQLVGINSLVTVVLFAIAQGQFACQLLVVVIEERLSQLCRLSGLSEYLP